MCVTPTLSVNPTLSIIISCILCQGHERGNDGPEHFGGPGGGVWDDGRYHGVRKITVASGDCIDSIRVAYDEDGELDEADRRHGGDGGKVHPQITLEYPNEFLVSVSGTFGKVPSINNLVLIRSLQFKTNRETYGPFGSREGTPFSFKAKDGEQIVGMKGRSGDYLDAIGFHIAHAPRRTLFCRVKESFKKLLRLSIVQCTGSQASMDDER